MYTLRIGFSKPKRWFTPLSWIIRLVECTSYSHVFLRWENSQQVDIVYEASGARVRFINGEIFDELAETKYQFEYEMNREQYRKLIRFCMENVGTEYGVMQIIGIALVRIGIWKKNHWGEGKSAQVCSETVAYAIREVLGKEIGFDVDTAGPRKIYNFLKSEKSGA